MAPVAELPPPKGTRFAPIRIVAETGSTNADLLDAAHRGAPEGSVLVADHQTAGRGRQQRTWHDDPGGALLVSILLRSPTPVARLLPLVAGLAAVSAVEALAGDEEAPVGLKWPNDVLATADGEPKLAGILAESTTARTGGADRLAVVVGMGLNLRWRRPPPPEVATRAVTLEDLIGLPVERDEVLLAYLRQVERWLGMLETEGVAPLLDAYRSRCLTLGRRVRFATATEEHEGTAVDVTDGGLLVLEGPGGRRVELAAGDAHHLDRPVDRSGSTDS